MELRAFGVTSVGRKRTNNEDAFAIVDALQLFVVADGMGGHSAGEVAAQLAVQHILAFFEQHGKDEDTTWPFPYDDRLSFPANKLRTAIALANERIQAYAGEHPESRGMGTTVVAALSSGDRLVISHVGDSRAYLFRDGSLKGLTADHSWVSEQVRMGLLKEAEAANHPLRNVITKALGTREQAEADLQEVEILVGDRVLLCSDGLNSMATDAEIEAALIKKPAIEKACHALVDLANDKGGEDNITVILIDRVG
jgi:serine/threonine protein phosphatase PrpC